MLYVSTKDKTESFTAYRVLHADKSADGGLFAPFHLPILDAGEIEELNKLSFSETVSKILNLFFARNLTAWDVEFSIGRCPFKIVNLGQRIAVAELWHNNKSNYEYLVSNLYRKLSDRPYADVPQWVCIAIEIALLFGLYGELHRNGIESADLAVTDNIMHDPVSAWYARKMGLPIGNILCGCSENSGLWDFFSRGEASVSVPDDMQRLVFENFGTEEANRFVNVRESGRIYRLNEEQTKIFSKGIYPSVIGYNRIPVVVSSIQRTSGYTADPDMAIAYGTVQDYRAATGENRPTLLLSRLDSKE